MVLLITIDKTYNPDKKEKSLKSPSFFWIIFFKPDYFELVSLPNIKNRIIKMNAVNAIKGMVIYPNCSVNVFAQETEYPETEHGAGNHPSCII